MVYACVVCIVCMCCVYGVCCVCMLCVYHGVCIVLCILCMCGVYGMHVCCGICVVCVWGGLVLTLTWTLCSHPGSSQAPQVTARALSFLTFLHRGKTSLPAGRKCRKWGGEEPVIPQPPHTAVLRSSLPGFIRLNKRHIHDHRWSPRHDDFPRCCLVFMGFLVLQW